MRLGRCAARGSCSGFPSPAAKAGRAVGGAQPIVPWPDSYQKQGKVTPGQNPVVPVPSLSYKGGNRGGTKEPPAPKNPSNHRKMVGKPEQYGIKQYPGNPPSCTGK